MNKNTSIMNKMLMISVLFILTISVSIISASSVRADVSTGSSVITISMLNQDPEPARAGDIAKLRFQVWNSGDQPANNLDVQLVEDYPFVVVGGPAIQTIQTLAPFQTGNTGQNIEYTVMIDKDAIRNSYPMKLQYRLNGGSWITLNFNVDVQTQNYAQIMVDRAQIQPGQETQLNFTINNVGSAPLQNLEFTWQEPTGAILPVYSGDATYIKYLDAGKSAVISYTVMADVNAKPGLYALNLDLKYQSLDNATTSDSATKAGMFIGGKTDFDVSFSQSTAGQTSLSVSNTGNTPASSVSVTIPPQDSYTTVGSSSAIIGNLNEGDYTLVSFDIQARGFNTSATGAQSGQNYRPSGQNGNVSGARNFSRNSNSGNNDLIVLISYTDTTGERITVEKNVTMQLRSLASSGSTTGTYSGSRSAASSGFFGSTIFWILVVIVVIVGGYFGYKKYRRTKKEGKLFKAK